MLEKIKETAAFIQSKTTVKPSVGIILGTGLGGLVKEINIIDFKEIDLSFSPMFSHSSLVIKIIKAKTEKTATNFNNFNLELFIID